MIFDDKSKGIAQAYLSMLGESHFKVGDKVKCKASGMSGTVTKLDKPEDGKYYTVKQDSGKTMKYAPDELKKLNEAMDPVNKKAVKKDFDDREDKDIDNDGDTDSSDEYLHTRRKAISKAVKKEAIEIEISKKSKMNDDDDDDDDEDMVAKDDDKMKVKKKKDDDDEDMKEAVDTKKVADSIEAYAKKSGGIDKADMMKVADMLKRGDMKNAVKYAKTLDTDPRDYILNKMGMMEDVTTESSLKDIANAAERRAGSVMKPKTPKAKPMSSTRKSVGGIAATAEKRKMREDLEWDWDAILEAPEEEINQMIDEMNDDDFESFMEEFDQIDEISTRTLARAAGAASDPDADLRYDNKGHDPQKFADYAKRKKSSKAAAAVQGAADAKGYSRPGRSSGLDKMKLRQNRSTNPNMVTKSGMLTKGAQKGLKSQMKEDTQDIAKAAKKALTAMHRADKKYDGLTGDSYDTVLSLLKPYPKAYKQVAALTKKAISNWNKAGEQFDKANDLFWSGGNANDRAIDKHVSRGENFQSEAGGVHYDIMKLLSKLADGTLKEGGNWYQGSTNSEQPMNSNGQETLDPRAQGDKAFANAHRQNVNIKDYPGKDKQVTNAKPQAPVRPGDNRNSEPKKTLSDIRAKMK